MSESITTSIRLSPKLRHALERKSKQVRGGKNWISSQALDEYLRREGDLDLEAEAKRQSLLASAGSAEDWSESADLDQWR